MSKHKWADPVRYDHTTTFRSCKNGCGLVKVTRHEPDNNPPHWIEWERDGHRFQNSKTPPCEEAMKADAPKEYRLVEIRAENVKKLKAVAVKVDGKPLFKVSGKNEQGKSSLLDAVMFGIAGKDAFPGEPIRKGEETAEVFLDFCDLKLTRKIWRKDGGGFDHSVTLEFADGKRPKEKQHVLDALRGSPIADDPIEFAKLKPKERYDMLKALVPNFDFESKAEERLELFEERTQVGRDLEKAKGAADSINVPPGAPDVPLDVTELATRLREASELNATIDKRAARREQVQDEIEAMRDRVDLLRAEIAKLEGEIEVKVVMLEQADPLPEKVDTAEIEKLIADADRINNVVRQAASKKAHAEQAKLLKARYDELSEQIKAIDEEKKAAIESAKLPVDGLEFGEKDIMLDGLPFDQASTARKIRVSTALLMALKPQLRVLLVREGSLLDVDARKALEDDAKANDFVVLMECVGEEAGPAGVVIVDGQVQ